MPGRFEKGRFLTPASRAARIVSLRRQAACSTSSYSSHGPLTTRFHGSPSWPWCGPLTIRFHSSAEGPWRGPLTTRSDTLAIETTVAVMIYPFLQAYCGDPIGLPRGQLCRLGKNNFLRRCWRMGRLIRPAPKLPLRREVPGKKIARLDLYRLSPARPPYS